MSGIYNDVPKGMHIISRVTFYLWMFVASQDLFEDALEFLENNLSRPLPFETCFNASAGSVSDDYSSSGH